MGGKQRFFYVGRDTVTEEIKVTSVAVSTTPHKTDYIEGDKLDTTGLSLTVTYSDGSTQTVTSGFTCDKTTLSAGDSTVTVTFEGFTAQFQVTIQSANPIVAAGNYGALYWELTQDGTLTLTGSGDMPDAVSDTDVPWHQYKKDILVVQIGEGITDIGAMAFFGSTNMVQITIPDSVTSIGESAFRGCSGLTQVDIPDGVTTIGSFAFMNCFGLTQINIPDGVTTIGMYAFRCCSGLTQIDIPNSSTSIEIGTFYECTGLTQINIPDSIINIEGGAFFGCIGLTQVTIPDRVTSIDEDVFRGCSGLAQVTILSKDCTIGDKSATFAYPNTTTVRGYAGSTAETYAQKYGYTFEAIDGEGGDVEVENPILASGTYGENITWELREDGTLVLTGTGDMPDAIYSVDVPWYMHQENIQAVRIEQGITSIGQAAFGSFTNLTQINISNSVTRIGYGAFSGCASLSQINIPDSVISIDAFAFSACTGLTQVSIPSSVASIGDYAFCECSGLKQITILNKDCTIDIAFTETLGAPGKTIVRGYKGSTVETYAQKYGYTFEALD